jgi:hypothetical protein
MRTLVQRTNEKARISTELKQKLAESGWLDSVRRIANGECAAIPFDCIFLLTP